MTKIPLTKQNEESLIDAMIAKVFISFEKENKEFTLELINKIKQLKISKNKEAILKQAVFVILINQIINKEPIAYEELAKKINQEYKLNIPEKGSALGKILGNVLGSLSIISYINADILISLYVVNKHTKKPEKGLIVLKNYLDNVFNVKEQKLENRFFLEIAKLEFKFDFLRM